jgi:hypothetical protein
LLGQITHSTVYEWFDYNEAIYDPLYEFGYSVGETEIAIKNWYRENIYEPLYNLGYSMGKKRCNK